MTFNSGAVALSGGLSVGNGAGAIGTLTVGANSGNINFAISGGKINGAFLKHKLIDEFSTLIHPAIDGLAGVQSIVDYDGPEGDRPGAGQSLRLTHCETLEGGMVWLRHAVERAPD